MISTFFLPHSYSQKQTDSTLDNCGYLCVCGSLLWTLFRVQKRPLFNRVQRKHHTLRERDRNTLAKRLTIQRCIALATTMQGVLHY